MLSRIQLRQFLAVVDTGSFTRAANALNIAQPSLSGGIAELERNLGTRLFVRERRRIQLTEAGNALLPLARSIEREFHEAESRVGNLPVPARPLRLGLLESVSTRWLESTLSAYTGLAPLELVEGGERELQAALVTGSLDLALTLVGSGDPAALLHEAYCLALPADHPLAGAVTVPPRAVAGETMLARRSCEVLTETSRFFTEHGVRPRFALRSANDDRIMAAVRAGLGVTVAPESLGGPGISMVKLEGFTRNRTIGLVEGTHEHDGTAALLAALRAALS
ncbi:LysR family transcriptional regulator [Sphingobium sp. Sx8-8]|uniref:LysR family transcriptional regulator n=1 Tax=Sphingobium sp. Sx8-8 TaxID=2933617 RepID=UPI001F59E2DC|nr:LysR family transcriptional regulator [Sphingobium sp. Sx8-8]